jgi:hypothetical protein
MILGRVTHAHVQRLVSVAKMATVFEERITENQHSVALFCVQEDSMISVKKCFLFMLESDCRVKRLHLGGKRIADDEEVETEVRKWLRQQSEDFYVGKAMG